MSGIEHLEEDARRRLKACEIQRGKLGRPTPQELYWAGYLDALCQVQGKSVASNVNWASEGVTRMMSRERVASRIREEVLKCRACKLGELREERKEAGENITAVPGRGPLRTPLMLVGEAPGAQEEIDGIPFCGKAGQLLDQIVGGIGFTMNHVRIANTVNCRPPGNRNPAPEETHSCARYLRWDILNVDPKVIIALGSCAVAWFKGHPVKITQERGKPFTWEHITVVPTFHPAYLLRPNGREQMPVVEQDFALALDLLRRDDGQ